MNKINSAGEKKPSKIIDINKHGIRREMFAAGNKTVKKLNKKNKIKE